jgi:hypothetical protein
MVIGDLVIEKKKANQSITKSKVSEARSNKVSKKRSILSIERIEIHQSITNQSITNAPTLPLLSELFEPDHTTRCGADRSGGM